MNSQPCTIVIIGGPTASGKSARAMTIARKRNGVIINADAMQVYKELSILTARPSAKDEAELPHRLYGTLPASTACSAALWLEHVRSAIDEALANGQCPVVTGGTGLYLKTLMEGLSPIPDVAPALRAEATALYEQEGAAALHRLDPVMAERLKVGDTQRQVRALSVFMATGKSLAYWQEQPRVVPYPQATFEIEVIDLARDTLYARCNARFLAMLEAGALEEVRALHALNLAADLPCMRAVGVPELLGVIRGEWSLETAIIKAQQATRNYAKRQITWFKNQLTASLQP